MRSFGEWFNAQEAPTIEPQDELPEGIIERDGKYLAECRGCEKLTEIPVGIDEIPQTGYEHYCGGNPWCCP